MGRWWFVFFVNPYSDAVYLLLLYGLCSSQAVFLHSSMIRLFANIGRRLSISLWSNHFWCRDIWLIFSIDQRLWQSDNRWNLSVEEAWIHDFAVMKACRICDIWDSRHIPFCEHLLPCNMLETIMSCQKLISCIPDPFGIGVKIGELNSRFSRRQQSLLMVDLF